MGHRRRLVVAAGVAYEGPLDIVAGAVVAYGQRALCAAKLGTALYTIRESSGDTTQSFSSDATTGEAPVASITTFLNGNAGFGTVWVDQSGSGANVLQATEALQFQWLAAQAGTRPAFTSPNTGNYKMDSVATFDWENGAATIFLVIKGGWRMLAMGEELEYVDMTIDGSNSFINSYDPSDNSAGAAYSLTSPAAYAVVEAAWEFGSKSLKINGTTQTPGSDYYDVSPVNNLTGLVCKIIHVHNADSGGIVEVIGYDSILTDQQRSDIRTNIADYYGITLS